MTALPGGGKCINKLFFAYAVGKCGAGDVKTFRFCIVFSTMVSVLGFSEVAVCRTHR